MAELTRKQYLLRKTLDGLEIVADWDHIPADLVNSVLKDMGKKNQIYGKFMDLGYEHRLREIPKKLESDLIAIQNSVNDNFFKEPLNLKIEEKIQDYKKSDSFEKIWGDYYQSELAEMALVDFLL